MTKAEKKAFNRLMQQMVYQVAVDAESEDGAKIRLETVGLGYSCSEEAMESAEAWLLKYGDWVSVKAVEAKALGMVHFAGDRDCRVVVVPPPWEKE